MGIGWMRRGNRILWYCTAMMGTGFDRHFDLFKRFDWFSSQITKQIFIKFDLVEKSQKKDKKIVDLRSFPLSLSFPRHLCVLHLFIGIIKSNYKNILVLDRNSRLLSFFDHLRDRNSRCRRERTTTKKKKKKRPQRTFGLREAKIALRIKCQYRISIELIGIGEWYMFITII